MSKASRRLQKREERGGWGGSKRADASGAGGSVKLLASGTQNARHCGGAMPGMKC